MAYLDLTAQFFDSTGAHLQRDAGEPTFDVVLRFVPTPSRSHNIKKPVDEDVKIIDKLSSHLENIVISDSLSDQLNVMS